MAKKRERLEVIYDILAVLRDKGKVKPTRLLSSSNLSHVMFKEYVQELLEKEFIEELVDKKGRKEFSLQTKGYEFLSEYRVITNFIENFGL